MHVFRRPSTTVLALALASCRWGSKGTESVPPVDTPPDSGTDTPTDTHTGDSVDDTGTIPPSGNVCPDGHEDFSLAGQPTPPAVVLISVDTVNRRFLGRNQEWDTTPNIDAFQADAVVFENVLVTRGLSAPSIASLITGAYPRHHGLRDNDVYEPEVTTLLERYQYAGYETIAVSGNMCFLAEHGVDQYFCNWNGDDEVDNGTVESDQELVDAFVAAFAARDTSKPTFAWLHLMSPHDPYVIQPDYYAEFHPDTYEGDPNILGQGPLAEVTLGTLAWTEADQGYLDAVYASEIRGMDDLVGRVIQALVDAGVYDESIVAIVSDHGEELAERDTLYMFHGCSIYNPVVAGTYAIRAPGRMAGGEVIQGWVSSVDLAPTLLELSGLPLRNVPDGTSWVSSVYACEDPGRPAYFERGVETAGVILDGMKYVADPNEGYTHCKPYTEDTPYPGKAEQLFDLNADPGETRDLVDTQPGVAVSLHTQLCDWLTGEVWQDSDADTRNPLILACQ